MGKRTAEKETPPRYGITPQAFILLGLWIIPIAVITLAGGVFRLFQWLMK